MEKDGGLRNMFRARMRSADWQTIETSATSSGTPDCNGCLGGVEVWIEFKRTDGWKVTIRPAQRGWCLRRAEARGRVWVAVRQLGLRRDDLWLVHGSMIRELSELGLGSTLTSLPAAETLVHHWPGGPAKWPWTRVEEVLFN